MSDEVKSTAENFEFQAEIKQLMHILAHSLYKNKEVFVRELISNSVDALEKVRFQLLTRGDDIRDKDAPMEININLDKDQKIISIVDTGIGMTRQELIDNIGRIAHSGSIDFFRKLSEDDQKNVNLIGQFGVGFYSVFMAAEKVEVTTCSYLPNETPCKWVSAGQGSYSIEPIATETPRGTRIDVFLREDDTEFVEDYRIKNIVTKYSNFMPVPIKVNGEQANKVNAIWAEPKSNLKEEDYNSFYKFITHMSDEPLFYLHLSIDMPVQFHALLFVPKSNTELLGFGKSDHRPHLYARRVLIQQDSEDLLPDYLRFFRGVVDCDDLPLNVSRETLQENRQVQHMQKALVGKILSYLTDLAKNNPEKYTEFWNQYSRIFKEGYTDYGHQDRIKPLLRFESSMFGSGELVSLEDYLGRMVEGQTEIYFLSGLNRATLEKSPHLEIFKKKGIEVLYLFEPLDEFMLSGLRNFMEKDFKSIDQVDLEKIDKIADKMADDSAKDRPLADDADLNKLIDHIKVTLGDKKVKDVRVSKRLTESPAVLVSEDGMTSHMQKVMKLMNQDAADFPRTMEINPKHPLIVNLTKIYKENPRLPFVNQACHQLYDNASFLEGFPPDPNDMVSRLQEMMAAAAEMYAGSAKNNDSD